MKKIYYDWKDIEGAVLDIARQLYNSNWHPDYIVGLTRGGLVPANLLSQYTGVKMHTLNVSLRDGDGGESNCWMAEDAFGYDSDPSTGIKSNADLKKKILIVDDINDSGATLNWIKEDWRASCLPNAVDWNYVWGNNVRTAVLTHNVSSEFKDPDYYVWEVNKAEDDCWLVYPWEEFWR